MQPAHVAPSRLLATNNTAMFLYGLSAVLVGPTLPGMIEDFSLSLSAGGFIGSMQNAGGVMGAVLALWIADRLSRPGTAVVAFVLLGLALVGVGLSRSYLLLIAVFAATGLCIRVLDVMLNAHTGDIGTPSAMSTLHMFFSIGAFVGPVVARALMEAGTGWDAVYRYVGLAYVLIVVVGYPWLRRYVRFVPARHRSDEVREAGSKADAASAGHGSAPTAVRATIVLLGMALFFYAIHQVGVSSWLPYFLESSLGANSNLASFGLSLYWVGIIVGRFTAARLVSRIGVWHMLVAGMLVASVASAVAAVIPSSAAAIGLYVVAGVASGATIPLAYSGAYALVPARRGSVTATMSIIMLSGRFLGPWLIGSVADATTLVLAMTIPGFALVLGGVLAGGAVRASRPRRA